MGSIEIPNSWSGTPREKVARCLFDYLCSAKVENLRLLTYLSLARVCNDGIIDEYLIEAIMYFCADSVSYLDVTFLLIDEKDEEYELDRGVYTAAEKYGYLVHPFTGEKVQNYDDMIYLTFSVTDNFVESYR